MSQCIHIYVFVCVYVLDHVVTASDFSIEVTDLPEKNEIDREEVLQYFSQWGKVVDVTVLYNRTTMIKLMAR